MRRCRSTTARIELDEDEKPALDDAVAALTEDEAEGEQERLKRRWANVEAVVGAEKRLRLVARDLVEHFESRVAGMDGKAMIVCMSRRICVALHDEIVKLRPDWHCNDDEGGVIKIVMTDAASDPEHWQPHVGGKARRELLAKRIRDPDDALRLVIVRDMWLTGFDAPSLHTMYVDKPMRGHGLMQAIARVNRVFRDKPAGLIVDYIGIAQNLKSALGRYSRDDRRHAGIDAAEAVAVLREKYEIVSAMFHGFDFRQGLAGSAQDRLAALAGDIRAAHRRGEEEGLGPEEVAFYDALARNESAVEVMGNDHLRLIAHELLIRLKSNASVDWQHRESARARMRVLVKRILRKHGYPPDLQDAAVQTVLQQAEALSARGAA